MKSNCYLYALAILLIFLTSDSYSRRIKSKRPREQGRVGNVEEKGGFDDSKVSNKDLSTAEIETLGNVVTDIIKYWGANQASNSTEQGVPIDRLAKKVGKWIEKKLKMFKKMNKAFKKQRKNMAKKLKKVRNGEKHEVNKRSYDEGDSSIDEEFEN